MRKENTLSWLRFSPLLLILLCFAHGVGAATTDAKKRVRATIQPTSGKVTMRGARAVPPSPVARGAKSSIAKAPSGNRGISGASRGGKTLLASAKKSKASKAAPRLQRVVFTEDEDPINLSVRSGAALVIDLEQGQPVYEKNTGSVMPIASITKLMTSMVVLDAQLPLSEQIMISDEDLDVLKGTRSRLPVGAILTRRELLRLALMASENSAAAALGRSYPGGTAAFVRAMNRKAKEIGTLYTRFDEPTGLSSNNVSTARELSQIVRASYRYELIREYSTTESYEVEVADGRERLFRNTNGLVRSGEWEIGLQKTGYISEAGRCLVMQATIAAKPYIIVLLDAVGRSTRIADANRIKRWIEVRYTPRRGLT
jgi:D-alanyl-D-alanine endopeptidase (penicillin-binding protein 7)